MKEVIVGIFALVFCLSSFKGISQQDNDFNSLSDEDLINNYSKIGDIHSEGLSHI